MRKVRLVARLDIKNGDLIKGIHLEGLRRLGPANLFAKKYYEDGIDEIIYLDSVASLYNQKHLCKLIESTAKNIFIPLTVGGGIRTINDAALLFKYGADKVAINTAAIENPKILSKIANRYGRQALVLSIEAKRKGNLWEAYTKNGKQPSGKCVIEWVSRGVELGAGEVLLTSIDQEGTRRGFDIKLIQSVVSRVDVPVIASGGMGKAQDFKTAVSVGGADAVAVADMLHYKRLRVSDIKKFAYLSGIKIRM